MNNTKSSTHYSSSEKAAERELDAWLLNLSSPRIDILQELRAELGK